jgi:hypothetical protein
MIEGRALEIAKTAIVNVFKRGGETTVALPKGWTVDVTVERNVRGVAELKVKMRNMVKLTDEIIFYRELASAMVTGINVYLSQSYVGSTPSAIVYAEGRVRISVRYETSEEVVVAFITLRKV